MSAQCPSQWQGHGCGRPAGHAGEHYSADRMGGWCSGVTGEKVSPWSLCGAPHPTAGFTCYCVKGHKGKHFALTVPMPEGEPTKIEARPYIEWSGR